YYLLSPSFAISARIDKAPLSVDGLHTSEKPYDGMTDATVTGTPIPVGILGEDGVTITGSATGTFAGKDVDTHNVAVTGLSLDGTDKDNYALPSPLTISGVISSKSLTITGITGDDKFYDGTTTATLSGTARLVGVVGTEDVTLAGSTAVFGSPGV